MEKDKLQISQFVLKHPILEENEDYKQRYINVLEYFVEKYSADDLWAASMLELYKNKLLSEPSKYSYNDNELKKISKGVMSWKMKKFKFFSFRYCLLIDTIFICSFTDKKKSDEIYSEISGIYNKRYLKRLEALYHVINGETNGDGKWEQTEYMRECLAKNRSFLEKQRIDILVTANMSAGKSTLLNAIVGKKVNKTQNDACTAKTHYLLNKSFEDTLSYEYDHDLELDASLDILMEDNDNNREDEIAVGTRFRSLRSVDRKVCFIDTPGVNSSQDNTHRDISWNAISTQKYDLMLYLLNGENIGTDDDRKHLMHVAENYKGKIIFVVNKLDRYKANEDSVKNTLLQVESDLKSIGYDNPIICPVSAYAAYLAKMDMYGEELNDDELEELGYFYRKLNKKEYQFNEYYPDAVKSIAVTDDKNQQLLLHSGILSLEQLLYEER